MAEEKDEIKRENDILTCEKCGGYAWEVCSIMVYKTRLMNPQMQKDMFVPVKTFRCADCKSIPDEYNYLKQQEKGNVNLI